MKSLEDLVEFPKTGYKDTGEGGLAVFFILPVTKDFTERRQKCVAGDLYWTSQDVVIAPTKYRRLNDKLHKLKHVVQRIDLAMLVASTKKALSSEEGDYWRATKKDLTGRGRTLYKLLTKIYGQGPDIVTLLDT